MHVSVVGRRRFDHCSAFETIKELRPFPLLINVVVDGSTMRTCISLSRGLSCLRFIDYELVRLKMGRFDSENVQLSSKDPEGERRKEPSV
jgi:hypothetical protein